MPYCVHCGVELAAEEKKCPLCDTVVIDPTLLSGNDTSAKPLYPSIEPPTLPRVSRRSIFSLLAVLILIPSFVTLVCDLSLNGAVTWSAYVLGAAAALLLTIAFALLSRNLRSYGVVLASSAVWTGYAFFADYIVHGKWSVPFVLPMLVYLTLTLALLCFLVNRRLLSLAKLLTAVLLICGGLCVLIEWRINSYFDLGTRFVWSYYPAGTSLLLALLLLIIDRSEALKARLRQKFFI